MWSAIIWNDNVKKQSVSKGWRTAQYARLSSLCCSSKVEEDAAYSANENEDQRVELG